MNEEGHWVWWRKASKKRRFYSKSWSWSLFCSQGFSQKQCAIVIIIGGTIAAVSVPVDSNRRDRSFTYVGFNIMIRAELGLPGLQDMIYAACIHSYIFHYWPHFLKLILYKYCSLLILLDYERHVKVRLHVGCYAKRALMLSTTLYLKDNSPVSGQGESIESLPIIYLFPLHTTVLLKSGTNQMKPIRTSFNGPST